MSVLLINPPTLALLPNKEFIPPSSLLYLAGMLQGIGINTRILDLNVFKPWEAADGAAVCHQAILQAVSTHRPSLVGFTCLFSGQFPSVLAYAEHLKRKWAELPIVIGGMHPTIYAREILSNCNAFDYVVIGEGELQIVALAQAVAQNDPSRLEDIDGIAFRQNRRVVLRPKQRFIENLDRLPFPAYDLIDWTDYNHPTSHWYNPKNLDFNMTVPLVSSRSCPNRCNFCSMFMVMGPKIRTRSAQNVADEIQWLYEHYGQNHFSFMDDNINLVHRHILSICDEILKRGLNIQFETPNGLSVTRLNREVIDAMAAAGWVRGAIAIESGSDFIRNKVVGKRLEKKKIMEVIRLVKRHPQIYLKAFFIIGFPEETPQTLMETYRMIEALDLNEVYVTNLMPFPGTAIFQQALRDDLFVEAMDISNLWRKTGFHYHENRTFYIKPYQMSISELKRYREKFDRLLAAIKSEKETEQENVQR